MIILALIIAIIILYACIDGDEHWATCTFVPIVIFTICVFICTIAIYPRSIKAVENMKAEVINIENVKILTMGINNVAIVKLDSNGQNMIVDVANLKQSTIASDVYIEYVDKVNHYNTCLFKMRAKRSAGFWGKLWWGHLKKLPNELVPITIINKY